MYICIHKESLREHRERERVGIINIKKAKNVIWIWIKKSLIKIKNEECY